MKILLLTYLICLLNVTSNLFLGKWNYKGKLHTFEMSNSVNKKVMGYEFVNDSMVLVRTNTSGCAVIDKKGKRSRITLSVIEGTYSLTSDSTATVKYSTFMGDFGEQLVLRKGKLVVLNTELTEK